MDPIINCSGFKLNNFVIPPFKLNPGEFLRIYFPAPPKITLSESAILHKMIRSLIFKESEFEGFSVKTPFPYADLIIERPIIRLFYPLTVKRFLYKHQLSNKVIDKIISKLGLALDDKISTIGFGKQKALVLFALSNTSPTLSFDFNGLDYKRTIEIEQLVRDFIRNGKTVIGFDNQFFLQEKESINPTRKVIIKMNE